MTTPMTCPVPFSQEESSPPPSLHCILQSPKELASALVVCASSCRCLFRTCETILNWLHRRLTTQQETAGELPTRL